ncbi:MAG: DctP family TRAP transporter solute-binding subunit [Halanaerobiales bacterium]
MKFSIKTFSIITFCISLILIFGGLTGAIFAQEDAEVVLRVSNAGPGDSEDRTVIANDTFKDIVESKTNGRIKVETYHASELGDERETYEGMTTGTIEMGTLTTGPLPGFFEPILVLDIPYLFESEAVAWEVMNGSFGEEISEKMTEETGIRPLAWADHGYRHFTNDKRLIESPEDMEGLKIRTMENPAHMDMVKELGANPTPMSFSELYTGLEQGTVDGQETPITLIKNMSFYEVQDYLVMSRHVYNFLGLFISEDVYQSLDESDQKIIREAAQTWEKVHTGYSKVQINRGVEDLEEEGMEVKHLSNEELEKFKETTQGPVIDFLRDEIDEKWIEKILNAVEKAEDEI